MSKHLANTPAGLIEFTVYGQGTPVVFVHGGHSNCEEFLCHKGFDKKLFQLITPSRPGYGKTPLAHHQSPRKAADLLVGLLDLLGLPSAIFYGVSAGGPTAIEMAAHYPQRVTKLILASAVTHKWMDKKSKTYVLAKTMFHPKAEAFLWRSVRAFCHLFPQFIAKNFLSQFSTWQGHAPSRHEALELCRALQHYRSGRGFINDLGQGLDGGELEMITCPTLILHSRYDKAVSPLHAQHAKAKIPHARLVLYDNPWGHLLWLGKEAAALEKTIQDFTAE